MHLDKTIGNRRNSLVVLELPFNAGLKEPFPGHEPGVNKLPDHLKKYGFHGALQPVEVQRLPAPPYTSIMDAKSGVRNVPTIISYAIQQAELLQTILNRHQFPLLLGGDCSILIGTALALNKLGRYGLFYLDGHTDYMSASLSQSGGAAGMDLAIVTGYGHPSLTNIGQQRPYFQPSHVWCVGNREYEQAYVNEILQSAIQYTDLADLRKNGSNACTNSFLQMIEQEKLDGFWIHIDVDVLDDAIMPAVDSRTPDGLSYAAFKEILRPLLASNKLTGLQITILDPDLDPDGLYTKEFITNFCEIVTASWRYE